MKMNLHFADLKDVVRDDFKDDVQDVDMSAEMRLWMAGAFDALSSHSDLRSLSDQGAVPFKGSLDSIDVIFCHPEDMSDIFGADEDTLGLHVIDTPDHDPFGDDRPYASKYRVLIPWDIERLHQLIFEDWEEDGFYDSEDAALSWLTTITHEIHHVLLFAENGNFNSPADLEVSEEDLGRDLFDFSTGYSIRALKVDGELIDADCAEDAADLMERYVEERGGRMSHACLYPLLSDFTRILASSKEPAPQMD